MKQSIIFFLIGILSTTVFSMDLVFEGNLDNGDPCTVEVDMQNVDAGLFTTIYTSSKYELSFFNNRDQLNASGLFQKDNGNYVEVIGAPIFALGTYYKFHLNKINDNYELQKETYMAYIFGWINTSKSKEICYKAL